MKISLIWTNYKIPWPHNRWGAIEKYIWEYKINLEKLGHQVDILFSNDKNLCDYDVVQSHTWNQSLNLYHSNIPYIYSFDDSHVIYYGKDNELYKKNYEAMKHSIITIVHSKYLLDYFGLDNMVYLRHGANLDKFKCINNKKNIKSLLVVGRTDQNDRKNLNLSIDVAKILDIPLTIVGPNEHFFKDNNTGYDKLTIIGDSTDEELLQFYNNHGIFLHPSKLETGHPNLTLIESIFCGTPVVGTCDERIDGLYNVLPNIEDIYRGIYDVMNNYDIYKQKCLNTYNMGYYSWNDISLDLLNIYEQFLLKK